MIGGDANKRKSPRLARALETLEDAYRPGGYRSAILGKRVRVEFRHGVTHKIYSEGELAAGRLCWVNDEGDLLVPAEGGGLRDALYLAHPQTRLVVFFRDGTSLDSDDGDFDWVDSP